MARKRITWVSPAGTAHVVALAWAAVVLVFLVIYIPLMIAFHLRGHPAADNIFPEVLLIAILLPVFYYALGWILGYVAAKMFNYLVRFTKGLEVEIGVCD